jgi:hypothetical protein
VARAYCSHGGRINRRRGDRTDAPDPSLGRLHRCGRHRDLGGWRDPRRGLGRYAQGDRVLGDGEEKVDEFEATTEASSFHTRPATAALIAAVENNGGSFAWGEASGVACTREEEAAAYV